MSKSDNATNENSVAAKQSEETKRISDVSTIQTELELFYSQNAYYPERALGSVLQDIGEDAFIDPMVFLYTNPRVISHIIQPGVLKITKNALGLYSRKFYRTAQLTKNKV
jgi:hypothetical protein